MSDPRPFRYVEDWQRLTGQDAAAIRAFWVRERANVEGDEAVRRVRQVVSHVLTADGELAAVSTATARTIPRLMQPMYYYRCFVGERWRNGRLVRPLLRFTFDVLERWARGHDFPCIGVLLELENEGFAHTLKRAHWPDVGFAFIGCSGRGLDLRVRYFRGARLKAPRQVRADTPASEAGRVASGGVRAGS
jgi:hypothetical protein